MDLTNILMEQLVNVSVISKEKPMENVSEIFLILYVLLTVKLREMHAFVLKVFSKWMDNAFL